MPRPQPLPYTLEPRGAFKADPDCPHCRHNLRNLSDPEYQHRHWRQAERAAPAPAPAPPPDWKPNLIWRALFKLYGDGGRERSL